MFTMIAALALTAGGQAAPVHNDEAFHREVIERLDRIERLLMVREREDAVRSREQAQAPRPAPPQRREDVVASANVMCGVSSITDCQFQARNYCRNLRYPNGVPLRIEDRGGFNYMLRVRCFE